MEEAQERSPMEERTKKVERQVIEEEEEDRAEKIPHKNKKN